MKETVWVEAMESQDKTCLQKKSFCSMMHQGQLTMDNTNVKKKISQANDDDQGPHPYVGSNEWALRCADAGQGGGRSRALSMGYYPLVAEFDRDALQIA